MSSYSFSGPPQAYNNNYDQKSAAAAAAAAIGAFPNLPGLNKASFSVNHILDLEELPRDHTSSMFANGPSSDTGPGPHEMGINLGVNNNNNNSSVGGSQPPCIQISPTAPHGMDDPQKSPMGEYLGCIWVNLTIV